MPAAAVPWSDVSRLTLSPNSIPNQVLAALEPGAAAVVVSHLFVTRTVVRARVRVRVRAGVGVRVKP